MMNDSRPQDSSKSKKGQAIAPDNGKSSARATAGSSCPPGSPKETPFQDQVLDNHTTKESSITTGHWISRVWNGEKESSAVCGDWLRDRLTNSCPYHDPIFGTTSNDKTYGRGLAPMERFMEEGPEQQHALFVRPDTGKLSTEKGCNCRQGS